MTKLHELLALGQSIWYDNIRRALIESGELAALFTAGVRGVTSNPSIFEKAIIESTDYDEQLRRLVAEKKTVAEMYEALVLQDIQQAADLARPIYEASGGLDGYVSLEVSPELAHDTEGTIAEARRLYARLDRPNVMIKVPATQAGIPAIKTLIGEGINVNVTLLFAVDNYEQVAAAYIAGLETLAASGGDLGAVASVASFFVSRVDAAADKQLAAAGNRELQGKVAIANAKVAYARFRAIFSGERWQRLAQQGASVQRVLWASTSTKNPDYPPTLYVDALIGPDTVNTVPPATLELFREQGTVAPTLAAGLPEAQEQLRQLQALGIDLDRITGELQDAGVQSFAASFASLMDGIGEKRERLLAGWERQRAHLGPYQQAVEEKLAELTAQRIVPRIWERDHTVWASSPDEITNRLGWLRIAEQMQQYTHLLEEFVTTVREDGYTDVLLLGMGGSSLAAEVFAKSLSNKQGYLTLNVVDSTDPAVLRGYAENLDLRHTLFIVASKSGSTSETLSAFRYYYNLVMASVGERDAGAHFVAITDPGTSLTRLAEEYHFRKTFTNDPTVGGRYSALSFFGLVPAALVGVDVPELMQRALAASGACDACVEVQDNRAARLGVILSALAKAGRDKVTFIASPAIASFGDWVEQLIAESTGKSGIGILPVVGEALGAPVVYGDDRLFIYLRLEGDDTHDKAIAALESAGQPVVRIRLQDAYDLGDQIFTWELATAVAGWGLGIHPFNQPNVEAAKKLARQMVEEYKKKGALPEQAPALTANGMAVYGANHADSVGQALTGFLASAVAGDYIALQAFVPPDQTNETWLRNLQSRLRDRTGLATTLGFGPRYLHSTGQLHKGDAGNGLFIQITADPIQDVAIPDKAGTQASSITFGTLQAAQALGDRQALLDAGRRVIRLHLGTDVEHGLQALAEELT
nr:bifunctional transaldolase/phosoglucose isomerase [Anaerolineae bacterium]